MESTKQPFAPVKGGCNTTVSRTVGAASAVVAVPLAEGQTTVRVLLTGATAIAFIRFTTSAGVAVTTDMPLLNGSVEVFTVPETLTNNGTLYVAAIGTDGTLYITPGIGA
jgi:hypothetical protein